jgi:hypothetical protein
MIDLKPTDPVEGILISQLIEIYRHTAIGLKNAGLAVGTATVFFWSNPTNSPGT